MKWEPIYIVDILGEVVKAVDDVLYPTLNKHIFYYYGRSIQILAKLQKLNQSITQKDSAWPLIALFQDFPEQTGTGYYATVKFPKISIAMLSNLTDDPPVRYGKTFKPVLYPIYGEFLRQLAKHPNVVGNDPGAFQMIKWDRPQAQKSQESNEYVDAIELQNMELTFKTITKCKS
jgi:hypothetical protein